MPTINEISYRVGELTRSMCAKQGLNHHSPVSIALVIGLDIGLTMLEASTGVHFSGFSPEAAARVVNYFREEAAQSEAVDPQIAIFYQAWADILTETYLKE